MAGDKLGVASSVEGIEWDAAGALSLAGRFFDLIVVRRSSSVSEDNQQDISSECLRASGRPVLIVPQEGSVRPTIGKRILLAWNGSREAALALQAGYPFLTTADHVTVALSETASKYAKVETLKSLDVEDLLKVHGLNYEIAEKRIPDAGAGADIVALAEATESDMIVMGSFGRSWLRNWALGSATSAAQAGARVPILTQH
ncbi:MAG: universal stress protein [Methylobacteriaceae bacterium]|nr:universal stress protein [Methylobacteriaceae bacterium]